MMLFVDCLGRLALDENCNSSVLPELKAIASICIIHLFRNLFIWLINAILLIIFYIVNKFVYIVDKFVYTF